MKDPIRIELPLGAIFPTVNCYLVEGPQLTLIDAGQKKDGNWEILVDEVRKAGYEIAEISKIILTHEHTDHIGYLEELLSQTNATIWAPSHSRNWLLNPGDEFSKNSFFMKNLFSTFGLDPQGEKVMLEIIKHERGRRKSLDANRVQFFEEGDFLEIGDNRWEALYTPGHCSSLFCFYQEDCNTIFGGDMLLHKAPVVIASEDWDKPGTRRNSMQDLINSFERLKKLNIDKVLPGHGEVYLNANEKIDTQILRINKRKEDCFLAVASGAESIVDITSKLYVNQSVMPNFVGMFMTLGYLDLLEGEEQIYKEVSDDNICKYYSKK